MFTLRCRVKISKKKFNTSLILHCFRHTWLFMSETWLIREGWLSMRETRLNRVNRPVLRHALFMCLIHVQDATHLYLRNTACSCRRLDVFVYMWHDACKHVTGCTREKVEKWSWGMVTKRHAVPTQKGLMSCASHNKSTTIHTHTHTHTRTRTRTSIYSHKHTHAHARKHILRIHPPPSLLMEPLEGELTIQGKYYNTLQHTATHCNTLQHTATFITRDPQVFTNKDVWKRLKIQPSTFSEKYFVWCRTISEFQKKTG